MINPLKVCKRCGKEKPVYEFSKHKFTLDRLGSYCKKCKDNYRKERCPNKGRSKHLEYKVGSMEYNRNAYLLCVYNISLKEYNYLLEQQSYRCAICGIPQDKLDKNLSVDHDHSTGEIRGLLCPDCNHGLGKFGDNPDILIKAIEYLTIFNKK